MNLPLNIEMSIEHLWGQEKFQKNNWGYINFLVGTNGTGKSLFAKQLKNRWVLHTFFHFLCHKFEYK